MEKAQVFVGTLRDLLGALTNGKLVNGTDAEALTPHSAMTLTKALVADVIDRMIQESGEHVGCALFGSHGSGHIKAQTACTGDGTLETLIYTPMDDHGATHKLIVSLRRLPLTPDEEETVSLTDVENAIERVMLELETSTRAADALTSPILANLPREMGEQVASEMETNILVLRCLKRMREMLDSSAR